jgi:hypothetical protein
VKGNITKIGIYSLWCQKKYVVFLVSFKLKKNV